MDGFEYLRGEWDSFKEFEKMEHAEIKSQLKELKHSVDNLNNFKWKTYGAVSVIAFVVSIFGAMFAKHMIG